jgi:hypothetical protein
MNKYNNPHNQSHAPTSGEQRPLNEIPTARQFRAGSQDSTELPGGGTPFQEHTMITSPTSTEPLAYLFIKEPVERFGYHFVVRGGNASIGRQANHPIQLQDPFISDPHGRIKLEKDESGKQVFALYDFGSENGSFVNGERVSGRFILKENDEINIGSYLFVFKTLM